MIDDRQMIDIQMIDRQSRARRKWVIFSNAYWLLHDYEF